MEARRASISFWPPGRPSECFTFEVVAMCANPSLGSYNGSSLSRSRHALSLVHLAFTDHALTGSFYSLNSLVTHDRQMSLNPTENTRPPVASAAE